MTLTHTHNRYMSLLLEYAHRQHIISPAKRLVIFFKVFINLNNVYEMGRSYTTYFRHEKDLQNLYLLGMKGVRIKSSIRLFIFAVMNI